MKSYSISRMRKECQMIYHLLLAEAVIMLIFCAVCGALWKVLYQTETKEPLIFTGVFLVLSLFLLGAYFLFSDEKWMLKHTLYGKTLTRLGDAPTLMREIDSEAKEMDYECASFALMRHWLVLYQSAMPQSRKIQSRPIPINHLVRIGWRKETREDNAGFWVQIVTGDGQKWEVFVWENADIEALRQWGASQEKMYDEL